MRLLNLPVVVERLSTDRRIKAELRLWRLQQNHFSGPQMGWSRLDKQCRLSIFRLIFDCFNKSRPCLCIKKPRKWSAIRRLMCYIKSFNSCKLKDSHDLRKAYSYIQWATCARLPRGVQNTWAAYYGINNVNNVATCKTFELIRGES